MWGKHTWRFLASLGAYSLIVIRSLVNIRVPAQIIALERVLKLHQSGPAAEHYRFLVEKIQCLFYRCPLMLSCEPLTSNFFKDLAQKANTKTD
jgi:hypothetical protein